MFADVCVNNFSGNLLEDVSSYAVDAYKKRNQNIFVNLEEYLLDEGNIFSADKIIEKLFPQIDVDIFLSHSHSDQDEVIKLAVKLEELGLKVFVDSCYWGYVSDLQKNIDLKYSRENGDLIYEKVIRTAASIKMILSSALHRMIDQTEAFIFINTPHSINIEDGLGANPTTSSAWIFSELYFVSRVKQVIPKRISEKLRLKMESSGMPSLESLNESVEIRFDVDLPKFKINHCDFNEWIESIPPVHYRHERYFLNKFKQRRNDGLEHLERLYKKIGALR